MEHTIGIGARIKACRLSKGVSAPALAARAGVTENAIRKIESGDSNEPRFSTGVRIAAALGIHPQELLPAQTPGEAPSLGLVVRRLRELRAELMQMGVHHISVFGSVARGEATSSSDVDLLIEPAAGRPFSLLDLAAIQQRLEPLLGFHVDVATVATLARSPAGRAGIEEAVRVF